MTDGASPLSAAEVAQFRAQLLVARPFALSKATRVKVDLTQLFDGTERLLATVEALQAQVDALTRALNQQGHIAEFRGDGYGLEHPVECRVAGLLNCAVDKACRYEQAPPAIGHYRVSIDAEGFLILGERVD